MRLVGLDLVLPKWLNWATTPLGTLLVNFFVWIVIALIVYYILIRITWRVARRSRLRIDDLIIGILRNALGTGTVLAFPGGMIGAFLAGIFYRYSRNIYGAALGEIIGTGLLAALVSAWIVAPAFMKKTMALGSLIIAFSGSTLLGSILGLVGLKLLGRAGFVESK